MTRSYLMVVLALTSMSAFADDGDYLPLTGRWANPPPRPERLADDADCRAHITKVVCYVEGQSGWSRPCLPDSKKYVPVFEALHDRLPPMLQKMFCSLEKLYVEKELESTAYALRGRPVIGIRASLIDEKLSLTKWATWKEQLNYGGKKDSYATREELPTYTSDTDVTYEDMVFSIIVHEFGHLFDFANDVNDTEGFSGKLKAGTYGAIGWETMYKPKAGNDFANRTKLCFYRCGSTLPASTVPAIYGELHDKTNFLNTYTARNPYEDFADTFSFYYFFKLTKHDYKLDTKQGKVYDMREALASDALAAKVKYLEAFEANEDKRYP